MNKTEYVIGDTGEVVRRQITETPIMTGDDLVSRMATNVPRIIKNAFTVEGYGNVSIRIDSERPWLTADMPKLRLACPYDITDGVLTPKFGSGSDPIIPIFWTPPSGMRLCMLMNGVNTGRGQAIMAMFLLALDERGSVYRLPLANVHDNCTVCAGEGNLGQQFPNYHDATKAALDRFSVSPWNADLWRNQEKTQALFRFKGSQATFEQLPPLGDSWIPHCEKVAIDQFKNVV